MNTQFKNKSQRIIKGDAAKKMMANFSIVRPAVGNKSKEEIEEELKQDAAIENAQREEKLNAEYYEHSTSLLKSFL